MAGDEHDLPYPGLRWPEEYLSIVSGKEQQDGTYQLASKDMLYLLWLKQRLTSMIDSRTGNEQ